MSEVVALNECVKQKMLSEFVQGRYESYDMVMDRVPIFGAPITALVESLYGILEDNKLRIAGGPYRLDCVFRCIDNEMLRLELLDGGYRIKLLPQGTKSLTREYDLSPELEEYGKNLKPFLILETRYLRGRPPFTGRLPDDSSFEHAILTHYGESDLIPTHLGIAHMVDMNLSVETNLRLGARRISSHYDVATKRFESCFVSKELHYSLEIDIANVENEDTEFNRRHSLDGITFAK